MSSLLEFEYHPQGYPRLGLSSRAYTTPWRKGVSINRLKSKLEAWEKSKGNLHFEARNLDKLDSALAYELVHVYTALREWYPSVKPDFIDFSFKYNENCLASAVSYVDYYPALREIGSASGVKTLDEIKNIVLKEDISFSKDLLKRCRRELTYIKKLAAIERPINLAGVGSIALSNCFSSKTNYKKLLKYWNMRNVADVSRGKFLRVADLKVSAASYVLMHEFGHMVDDILSAKRTSTVYKVWGVLSRSVYGGSLPTINSWGKHLINYPSISHQVKGPVTGGKARSKIVRNSNKNQIAELLGSYAPTWRDEIFAEAFALCYGAKEHKTKKVLKPFKIALAIANVGVGRRY